VRPSPRPVDTGRLAQDIADGHASIGLILVEFITKTSQGSKTNVDLFFASVSWLGLFACKHPKAGY